jgi:hypothetical protein
MLDVQPPDSWRSFSLETGEPSMTITRTFCKGAAGTIISAVLLALGPLAYAQSAAKSAPGPTSLFHKLDANDDGKVTFDEYTAYRDNVIWKFYDPKNTGHVNRKGYTRGNHARAIEFTRMDTNHNNVLEKAEFDTETKRLYDHRDRNKDGILTPNEFEKPRKRISSQQ